MKILGVTALVGLLLATALSAGDGPQPDFSGRWKLNLQKSKLETTAPTTMLFVIEHEDPKFKVTRTHTLGESSGTMSFEVTTDGKEHHRKEGEFESRMRMTWVGEELVLKSKLTNRGERGTNEAHYRLADGGMTLIADERFHMPSSQHHNLWVFDREQAE